MYVGKVKGIGWCLKLVVRQPILKSNSKIPYKIISKIYNVVLIMIYQMWDV